MCSFQVTLYAGEAEMQKALLENKMARRLAIQTVARDAFVKMQNDDQLRRAMLARSRTSSSRVPMGELCYIFRLPGKAVGRRQ